MKDIFLDPNRRFGEVPNTELQPWFTQKLEDLYRKCGRKNVDALSDTVELIAELREKPQYRTVPVGFIGRCFKGIINGENEEVIGTKQITFQNILIALNREARQHLPQGTGLDFEVTKKDYDRMFANAVSGNDPIAKGYIWAIGLCYEKKQVAIRREVSGIMAAACYLAGMQPEALLEGGEEDFMRLLVKLEPYVQKVEARIKESKERAQANKNRAQAPPYPRTGNAEGVRMGR